MRTLILASLFLATSWTAFGAGGGSSPSMPADRSSGMASRLGDKALSPDEQATVAYNAGVKAVEKADDLDADAARQTDAKKQAKLQGKAADAYAGALKKFTKATELKHQMYEAWNYVGYTNRKLGKYDAALEAYDRALLYKPGYPEAIEYRGHAYLGLNRLGEAKEAYLTLFAGNRALAAKLLTAMQSWIAEHKAGAGADATTVDAFSAWVSERSTIAAQTAGLTREGAASAWR
jgi:tetratricopeptide (TPR) repeat protein